MAYRHRLVSVVKYGRFKEVADGFHRLNQIAAARGWPQGRLLVPVVGRTNELSFETDYPDLATFERVQDEFYGDAEAMELWRGLAGAVIEGSGHDALLVDGPSFA